MRRTLFFLGLLLAGCGTPQPVLYPNNHMQTVGKEMAKQDIADCGKLAEEAGAASDRGKAGQVVAGTVTGGAVGAASGAVGGAVVGRAGTGAKVGAAGGATAGFLRSLFRPSRPNQAYKNFVDRCLKEKGYEPVGWK
jgi:hypothetical protein